MLSRWTHRLVALVLAIALAACSGQTSSGDTSSSEEPDDSTEQSTPSDAGGATTLRWATGSELGSLDVVADQVNGTTRRILVGTVLEGLTKINNDNDELSWEPLLAESWERVDELRWRFELREGVTFHDGSEMTAADVAYSINKLASPDSAKDSTLENVAGAEVVDDHTVDVLTKVPDFFAFRALSAIGIQPENWGADEAQARDTAIGTGPYRVESVSAARDGVVLVRNEDYWGDIDPYFDTIEARIIPDTGARLAALRANEIDVAFDLSPDLVAAAPSSVTAASTEIDILRISDATEALADQRVRQALNYAVDRDALINDLRFGFALPPKGQGVTSQVHGHNPDLEDYPYDPELAASLVEEAGAVGAELTMMCVSEYYGTVGTDTCQTLQTAYNDLGLVVSLQLLPRDQWVEQGLLAPQNEIPPPDLFYVQAGSGTLNSTLYIQNYYTCGNVRATLCDEELRDLSEAAMALDDPEEQAAAYQEVHALAREVAPMVWITSPMNVAAVQDGITGKLYSDSYTVYWYEWSRS